MRRQVIAGGALILGAGGCTLLVGTSGLAGGSGQGEQNADAAPDRSLPDATDGGNGTTDAGTDAPASTRFCDGHAAAIFCEDFDGPALPPARVTAQLGTAGVSASSTAPSPPNVFVAQVNALGSGQSGYASFVPPVVDLTRFHCAFDVSNFGGTDAIVFNLSAGSGTGFQAELLGDPTFAIYQEFTEISDGGLTTPFSWNGSASGIVLGSPWHHVDVCFDFSKNKRSLAIDGKSQATGAGVANWPSTGTLSFGVFASDGTTPEKEVHIDNVLVDDGTCPAP